MKIDFEATFLKSLAQSLGDVPRLLAYQFLAPGIHFNPSKPGRHELLPVLKNFCQFSMGIQWISFVNDGFPSFSMGRPDFLLVCQV